ncbi:MAG: hypothetical protein HXY22_09705 [Alphaproteobacteria bacterium]|nr:hypothetical protein [Alphaproteobacteria bacterium]
MRAQLARVLASKDFSGSPRLSRFLTFVVEEKLAGREAELKGYTIALAVFERGPDFDPATDPIVRVEGTRLRRALTQYYLTGGVNDPIRIDLPRGGYVPVFTLREVEPVTAPAEPQGLSASSQPARVRLFPWLQNLPGVTAPLAGLAVALLIGFLVQFRAPRDGGLLGPTIAVMPFENLSGRAEEDYFSKGLTVQVASALAQYREISVYSPDGAALAQKLAVEERHRNRFGYYVLTGSVRRSNGAVAVNASLQDMTSGQVIWSENYLGSITSEGLIQIEDRIAQTIARQVALPEGEIARLEMRRAATRAGSFAAYDCLLRAYAYWRVLDPSVHALVRDCLEKAIQEQPQYSAGYAALTFLYVDEYRYGFNPRPDQYDARTRALDVAQKAVLLDPLNAYSYEALYGAYFALNDLGQARQAGERALELNPNNPEILADFGSKIAVRGDWVYGLSLVRKALSLNPTPPGWYLTPLAYDAYRRGDYELARQYIRDMNMPAYYRSHVMRAMVEGAAGNREEAERALERVRELRPQFFNDPVGEMRRWGLSEEMIGEAMDGLRQGGLSPQS